MDNDRVEKLEQVTDRLMRRASKRTTALITPYPISNAVFGDKVEGVLLCYMFPCDGVISKGMFKVGAKPKKEIYIEAKLFNDVEVHSKGFTFNKKTFVADNLAIEVKSGDCLKVSLSPTDEVVTELWVSFLWIPTVKDVEVKSYLIEDLEDDLQKKRLTAE